MIFQYITNDTNYPLTFLTNNYYLNWYGKYFKSFSREFYTLYSKYEITRFVKTIIVISTTYIISHHNRYNCIKARGLCNELIVLCL